jgi:rod shape-determining protein MreC
VYERRRARILLAVLTLAALAFVTVDARAGEESPLERVRDGVHTVFGPLQDGLAGVLRPFTLATDTVTDFFRVRAENARLRTALEEEQQRTRSVADVARENEELRELLGARDELTARSEEFDVLTARVIALAPSNFEWTVTLNVGERDGVEGGMTVVNGDGLVGRIVHVGPTASRALLAIDRSFSAAVRIARNGEHGYLEGRGTNPLRFTLLDPEADVEEGDEVVTSTYDNAVFPDGLPIGQVSDAAPASGLLTREIEVLPYVDFTRLSHVLVILRAPPPPPLAEPVEADVDADEEPPEADGEDEEDGGDAP